MNNKHHLAGKWLIRADNLNYRTSIK